jgi:peptide/nickel transport system permease protein
MRHEASLAMAPPALRDMPEAVETITRGTWATTLRRLRRSKTAMAGLGIVLLLFLVAALADVLAPYSPTQTTPASLTVPTWQHLMGTDLLGRDVFSRVLHGSRVSVYVGVVSILLAILVGIPLWSFWSPVL